MSVRQQKRWATVGQRSNLEGHRPSHLHATFSCNRCFHGAGVFTLSNDCNVNTKTPTFSLKFDKRFNHKMNACNESPSKEVKGTIISCFHANISSVDIGNRWYSWQSATALCTRPRRHQKSKLIQFNCSQNKSIQARMEYRPFSRQWLWSTLWCAKGAAIVVAVAV